MLHAILKLGNLPTKGGKDETILSIEVAKIKKNAIKSIPQSPLSQPAYASL